MKLHFVQRSMESPPPLAPNEITLCTEVYGESSPSRPKWNYTLYRGLWRVLPLSPQMKLHFVQRSMESPPPLAPNEITLCTEVWVCSQPPSHPWARLVAPSFWKVWLGLCTEGCWTCNQPEPEKGILSKSTRGYGFCNKISMFGETIIAEVGGL